MKLRFATGLLFVSLICGALSYCAGCLSQQAKESLADSTYAAEHLRCVDKYDTKAEIDACRRNVRLKWGIAETVTDGGRDGR